METISTYFSAERAESVLFIAVGAIALAASVYFLLVLRKPFFNGMAITLSVVASLEIIVGIRWQWIADFPYLTRLEVVGPE